MPSDVEAANFARFIRQAVDGVMACLDGLSDAELSWRAPIGEGNTLAILAVHVLGQASQNVVEVLGGESVGRVRDEEFAGDIQTAAAARERWAALSDGLERRLAAVPDSLWNSPAEHYSGSVYTGREAALLVAGHANEHKGEAQLIRDLIVAAR